MYPELFHIGSFPIRAYGALLALSFVLSIWYVCRMSGSLNIDKSRIILLSYIFIFSGLVGSRLFYVLFHLNEFSGNLIDGINPFHSTQFGIAGLNIYGGIITALIVIIIFLRVTKINVLKALDIFAPTIGIGLTFTRLGCFLNGCCFGTPTTSIFGIQFPVGSIPWFAFGHVHIHPAQLYSSFYGLILFLFLHYKLKSKRFDGEILAWLLILEPLFRFAIEYVRYYESAMNIEIFSITMTWNQIISVIMIISGVLVYMVMSKSSNNRVVTHAS